MLFRYCSVLNPLMFFIRNRVWCGSISDMYRG